MSGPWSLLTYGFTSNHVREDTTYAKSCSSHYSKNKIKSPVPIGMVCLIIQGLSFAQLTLLQQTSCNLQCNCKNIQPHKIPHPNHFLQNCTAISLSWSATCLTLHLRSFYLWTESHIIIEIKHAWILMSQQGSWSSTTPSMHPPRNQKSACLPYATTVCT